MLKRTRIRKTYEKVISSENVAKKANIQVYFGKKYVIFDDVNKFAELIAR